MTTGGRLAAVLIDALCVSAINIFLTTKARANKTAPPNDRIGGLFSWTPTARHFTHGRPETRTIARNARKIPTRFRRLSRDVVGIHARRDARRASASHEQSVGSFVCEISCDRTLKIFCARHRDRLSDRSCSQGSRIEHLERAQDCSPGTGTCPPASLSLSAAGSTCARPATACSKEMKQCLKQHRAETLSLSALPLQSRQRLLKPYRRTASTRLRSEASTRR